VADETSQRQSGCRMVSPFAESVLAVIRSSSGTAAVHTAGERRRCFQIPDSLHLSMPHHNFFHHHRSSLTVSTRAPPHTLCLQLLLSNKAGGTALVIVTGNPGVFFPNPYPYPQPYGFLSPRTAKTAQK